MQNLNIKVLKVIAICLTALMVICMAILLDRSPKRTEQVEIEVVEAINNRERIIHHSGDLYCYTVVPSEDTIQYALLKLPVNFDKNSTRKIIQKYVGAFDEFNLDVYKNKIFFQNGATHYFDTITGEVKKFCDGELQFMLEPSSFVMLKDGNLYKGSYYATNYVVNSLEKIAEGNFINVGEDSKRVYYYSIGKTNSIVIGLDKETLNIIVYDNIETVNKVLNDVLITDSYLFEIYGTNSEKYIKRISKKRIKDGTYPSEELKIEPLEIVEFVDMKYTKPLLGNESFDDVYFYGSKVINKGDYYSSDELETKLYRYDAKNNEVKEYAGKLNELSLNRYSVISGDEGCVLRFDGKDMTKIPTSTNDFKDIVAMSVADVNIIEEYLYYEAKITKISGEVEIILARVPISGGESERINVPRKK